MNRTESTARLISASRVVAAVLRSRGDHELAHFLSSVTDRAEMARAPEAQRERRGDGDEAEGGDEVATT
jgi:hypothetical protein